MPPAKPPGPQGPLLLSLGRRETTRLLEEYVKRSLSINDAPPPRRAPRSKPTKWKKMAQRATPAAARSHSDGSDHPVREGRLGEVGRVLSTAETSPTSGPVDHPVREGRLGEVGRVLSTVETSPTSGPVDHPVREGRLGEVGRVLSTVETSPTSGPVDQPLAAEPERTQGPGKKKKKKKKPSALRRFLGLFSRKDSEEKEPREPSTERTPVSLPSCFPAPETPVVGDQGLPRSRRPVGRKPSFLKLSFQGRGSDRSRPQRTPSFQILTTTGPPAAVMPVEPMNAYYEKVSEELERIVKEVKDSPTDESHPTFAESIQSKATLVAAEDEPTIEKIISLLKQQGDAIDLEIKQNTSVSSFFQSLSYPAFQQLADRYVQEEVPSTLPKATPAPELVKFAFTLDFTAKLAGLSNQALSRIMGFGNQYLQDRFTQMSKDFVPEYRQSFMGPD